MNTSWKLPSGTSGKFVGAGNKLLSLVKSEKPLTIPSEQIVRHIRFFDKKTFEFIDEVEMTEIGSKYLRALFQLKINDPIVLSYPIGERQKKYMEKLSGIKINLAKFDYFMEN